MSYYILKKRINALENLVIRLAQINADLMPTAYRSNMQQVFNEFQGVKKILLIEEQKLISQTLGESDQSEELRWSLKAGLSNKDTKQIKNTSDQTHQDKDKAVNSEPEEKSAGIADYPDAVDYL